MIHISCYSSFHKDGLRFFRAPGPGLYLLFQHRRTLDPTPCVFLFRLRSVSTGFAPLRPFCPLGPYIHIYIYIYIWCMHIYIYIYIYTHYLYTILLCCCIAYYRVHLCVCVSVCRCSSALYGGAAPCNDRAQSLSVGSSCASTLRPVVLRPYLFTSDILSTGHSFFGAVSDQFPLKGWVPSGFGTSERASDLRCA